MDDDFRPADDSGIAVPSRRLLLEFFAKHKQPVTCEQLCAQFDLKLEGAESALASRLERLCARGLVVKDRNNQYQLTKKNAVVFGRVSGHANGFGFVITEGDAEDVFLNRHEMRRVLHGDSVVAGVKRVDDRGRKQGFVVEVIMDAKREIIGNFHLEKFIGGIGFVVPEDTRFARNITIPNNGDNGAKDGDVVVVKIIQHPVKNHDVVGEVVEVIGKKQQSGMQTKVAIRKHEIPNEWPAEVTAQLKKMEGMLKSVSPEKDRRDLRDLPLVTIDGKDAQDFDDAVYCEPQKDGWRLVVAIADVGHYVQADSALDREAFKRGNSVYFPTLVVPMLPTVLSNGICSLNPEEDRYCMVCDMHCDASGEVQRYQFYPGLMRSQARLTYSIVNKIVAEQHVATRQQWQKVTPHLDNLFGLYQLLVAKRQQRGAIDFEFPTAQIEFDKDQKINRISASHRNDAHRLIEECMLAANVCAARYLQENLGAHAIYRNHQKPDSDSVRELHRFLGVLGLRMDGDVQPEAADYAKLMQTVSNKPDIAPLIQMLLLRSLSQAEYSCEQHGHFALGYPIYTHFTSPIRRYSDLITHRQIRQLCQHANGESKKSSNSNNSDKKKAGIVPQQFSFEKIAAQCSFTERRAEDASRQVIAQLKAEFMQDKVGEQFHGMISAVKEFGLFVQLNDIFVDGLVHVSTLGDERYHFDDSHFQLIGERSGQKFRLGDSVLVNVVRVNLEDARIDFELCGLDKQKQNKDKPSKGKYSKGKPSKSKSNKPSKHKSKKRR